MKKIWIYSYQQTVKLLNQNRNYSQQTHTDGEVWFFHWCWGRWRAGTLPEFDIWGEELYNKRAYPFFKKKTELLMLKKKTEQIISRYSLIATSSSDYASYLHLLLRSSTLKSCKSWYKLHTQEMKRKNSGHHCKATKKHDEMTWSLGSYHAPLLLYFANWNRLLIHRLLYI